MPSSDQGCVRDTADSVVFLLPSEWTFLKIGSGYPAEQELRGQKRTDTNVSARHITKVSGQAGRKEIVPKGWCWLKRILARGGGVGWDILSSAPRQSQKSIPGDYTSTREDTKGSS